MKIGNNIKKIRIIRGLGRDDMADALSICTKQYGNIENDKSNLDVERLMQIAQILKVKPETILYFDEDDFLRGGGLQ